MPPRTRVKTDSLSPTDPSRLERLNVAAESFPPSTTSLKSMLPDGTDQEFRRAMYDFTSASAAMLEVRGKYAAFLDVSPPQFSILSLIGELGVTSVGELASQLNVSSPFVTSESNKLAKRGLIVKEASDQDRRSMKLMLTGAGRDLMLKIAPMRLFANDIVFGTLDEEESEQFRRIIRKLRISFDDCLRLLETNRWRGDDRRGPD